MKQEKSGRVLSVLFLFILTTQGQDPRQLQGHLRGVHKVRHSEERFPVCQ